jgi:hypothetical protein
MKTKDINELYTIIDEEEIAIDGTLVAWVDPSHLSWDNRFGESPQIQKWVKAKERAISEYGIYRFYFDCGRQGSLDGLFCALKSDIANLIGTEVYFGEVLGKHSEIHGVIEADYLGLITDDQAVVNLFLENNLSSGYNPLDYLE